MDTKLGTRSQRCTMQGRSRSTSLMLTTMRRYLTSVQLCRPSSIKRMSAPSSQAWSTRSTSTSAVATSTRASGSAVSAMEMVKSYFQMALSMKVSGTLAEYMAMGNSSQRREKFTKASGLTTSSTASVSRSIRTAEPIRACGGATRLTVSVSKNGKTDRGFLAIIRTARSSASAFICGAMELPIRAAGRTVKLPGLDATSGSTRKSSPVSG